mmetsp:Transcript_30240/g.47335  ORF Transcript_30240/g.47335 Transcript_30240/m.47335 type:complete len:289 (+) Transcript_30240:439-1305(+)
MRLEHCLPLIIVKEVVGVGHTKEQPGSALEVTAVRGVLGEQAAKERTVRGDTGTGGNHNDGGLRVGLRQKHDLAGRTSHLHLIPRLSIAQVVGAHTLLGGVLGLQLRAPVGGTANAEGHGVAGHVISISGRSDGVKSNRVGLAILGVQAGRQNAVRLALPVRHLAEVIDDDVASLTRGVLTNNSLAGDDLANMRLLVLVGVEGDARHVKVGVSLKEVLGLSDCRSEGLVEGRLVNKVLGDSLSVPRVSRHAHGISGGTHGGGESRALAKQGGGGHGKKRELHCVLDIR